MTKDKSCPIPHGVQDLDLKGASHNTLLLMSTVCTAVTLISSVALIAMHLYRYCAPREQRQILRIAFAPFVFALISLAEIYNYSIARYIDPISSFYEAICLCALFLLYIQFAAPTSSTFGEDLFDAVKAQQEAGTKGKGNWPRNTWIAVFQYPIIDIIAIIITEASEAAGTYCASSLRPKFGHFWSMLIHSVGIVVAVLAIFHFYGRMKTLMKARRGMAKLACFKVIVGLRFIQTWLFNILIDKDVLKPSDRFSYGDLLYGVPNALMCAETVLFSAAFWYAFSSSEYSHKPGMRRSPLWKAVLDALNPYDLIHGVARAVGLLFGSSGAKYQDITSYVAEPTTRSGRGRYRTLDGTESLARPDRSRSHTPLHNSVAPQSPPRYDAYSEHLSVGARDDRSQSPAVDTRCDAARGRDMV